MAAIYVIKVYNKLNNELRGYLVDTANGEIKVGLYNDAIESALYWEAEPMAKGDKTNAVTYTLKDVKETCSYLNKKFKDNHFVHEEHEI